MLLLKAGHKETQGLWALNKSRDLLSGICTRNSLASVANTNRIVTLINLRKFLCKIENYFLFLSCYFPCPVVGNLGRSSPLFLLVYLIILIKLSPDVISLSNLIFTFSEKFFRVLNVVVQLSLFLLQNTTLILLLVLN